MPDAIQILQTSGPKPDGKLSGPDMVTDEASSFVDIFVADSAPNTAKVAVEVSPPPPPEAGLPKTESGEGESDAPDQLTAGRTEPIGPTDRRAAEVAHPKFLPQTERSVLKEKAAIPTGASLEKSPPASDQAAKGEVPPKGHPQTEKASFAQAALAKSVGATPPPTYSALPAKLIDQKGLMPEAPRTVAATQAPPMPNAAPPGINEQVIIPRENVPVPVTRERSNPVVEVRTPPRSPERSAKAAVAAKVASPSEMPTLGMAKNGLFHGVVEVAADEFGAPLLRNHHGMEVSHAARAAIPSAPHAQAEVARHVGGQMAVAVSQNKAGVTEVALSPQELGRVRMTLTAQDNAMVLTIVAERPETQDLMRRHIDQLNQEFRAMGYQDVAFSFGEGAQARDRAAGDGEESPSSGHEELALEDTPSVLRGTLTDAALDLRL